MRTMLKSKIHRARVTDANIDYEGSITIDKKLMEEADILPYEQVQVLDVNNGARFTTYAIEGENGEICINGAAARLAAVGDAVIMGPTTNGGNVARQVSAMATGLSPMVLQPPPHVPSQFLMVAIWCRSHVQHSVPHFVEAVSTRSLPPLQDIGWHVCHYRTHEKLPDDVERLLATTGHRGRVIT